MLHVIVAEGLYDRSFIEQFGFGFEQFKAFLAAAQKSKIIHIGKKENGVYPIELGRKGRELEEDEE